MPRGDRLPVVDHSSENLPIDLVRRERDHPNLLSRLETLGYHAQVPSDERVHALVTESGRGVVGSQGFDHARPPTDLLLELPSRRMGRIFTGLELPGTELQQEASHRQPPDLDHQDAAVDVDRNHRDGSRVSNDLLAERPASPVEIPVPLHREDAALEEGLRLGIDTAGSRFVRTVCISAHPGDDTPMTATAARESPPPIFRLRGLTKAFAGREVLRGIDLDVNTGETLVVMGPSGCGKSVMLKHLVGLLKPDAGRIEFHGTPIEAANEKMLIPIRRRIGFLFQQAALFDSLNVFENVAFPLRETGQAGPDLKTKVRETLDRVGLADTVDRMPAELSGGMRKRVALARAIILDPEIILYDEPTTGLDPIRANVINDLIVRLQRDLNISSIVVTHDLDSAFQVGDRMVLLHHGMCHLEGTPDVFRTTDDPIARNFLEGRDPDGIDGATPRGTLATPSQEVVP